MERKAGAVVSGQRQAAFITIAHNVELEAHHRVYAALNQSLQCLEIARNRTFITQQSSQVVGVNHKVTISRRHVLRIQCLLGGNDLADIQV